MYEFIEGNVTDLTPAFTVIQTGGIGYFLNISLQTYSQLTKSGITSGKGQGKLYTHQVVREDAILLFGFYTQGEREIFRLLITVSGIGANTARMILSSLSPDELRKAIAEGNVNTLKSIKGIGLKTAQRIILDLKDKMSLEALSEEFFSSVNNTIKEESLSALVTLGFPKAVVEKLIDKLLLSKPEMTVEELIKQTLRNI